MTLNQINRGSAAQAVGANAAYAKKSPRIGKVAAVEKAIGDEIRISSKAIAQKEIDGEIKKISKQISDELTGASFEREEYLFSVKQQVESGTYTAADSGEIVSSILSMFV